MTDKTDTDRLLAAANTQPSVAGVPQVALARLDPGTIGNRDVYHSFGAGKIIDEVVSGGNAQRAREYLNEHRDLIKHTAKSYGLDPLTLGNVIYQEMRHRNRFDDDQDKNPREHPGATFGAGQVNVKDFKALVDRGILKLKDDEASQYNSKDPNVHRTFCEKFLTDERCIRATAALITQRLNDFSNAGLITKNLGKDYDERTIALGQFIYGAGLYPKGSRSGDANFDKYGPTNQQINFNAEADKTLVGLAKSNIPHKDKIITAFHYLPETFEALYMLPAPHRLGGYFNERSVLRKASADMPDEGGVQLASAQSVATPRTEASITAVASKSENAESQPPAGIKPDNNPIGSGVRNTPEEINTQVAQLVNRFDEKLKDLNLGLTAEERNNVAAFAAKEAVIERLGTGSQLTIAENNNSNVFVFNAYSSKDVNIEAAKSIPAEKSLEQAQGQLVANAQSAQQPTAVQQGAEDPKLRGPFMA